MFTGIILGCAKVITFAPKNDIFQLCLELPNVWIQGLQIGASVAINGTCLTVVRIDGNLISFDLIPETLKQTNLAELQPNDRVHVERALRIGDEIGGHQLSGHIIGQGILIGRITGEDYQELEIGVPLELMVYILPKGYIALDGVSLTVIKADTGKGSFTLQLIPETLRQTTLGQKKIGSKINIEIDYQTQVIVETVKRMMRS